METDGSISTDEASAALASAERSRARVAWSGYPAWYWPTTAAGLAVMAFAMLLPDWWDAVGVAVLSTLLTVLNVTVSRTRGVCEGWTRSAMRWRDVIALYGPAVVLLLANALMPGFAGWSPIVAAVLSAPLVFLLFAGTAFTLSARAARR